MNDGSVEGRLLKGIVQLVLDADFTAKEARAAARVLRDGKIFAPVAHLLDVQGSLVNAAESTPTRPSRQPTARSVQSARAPGVDYLFDTVKRRKITKAQLFEMFHAVNSAAAPEIPDQVSIREALASFRALASDDDWATLYSIVEGRAELDPFLRGMLNR